MKKPFILVLIFSLSFSWSNHAQRNLHVIAESGLNLRAKPKKTAMVIAKIPYFEKVTLEHKNDYGVDTLTILKTETQEVPLVGKWLKVSHKGNVGFVHSSYLQDINKSYQDKNLNQDYILLKPGMNCLDNLHDKRAYHWYGLYHHKEGTSLSEIDFEYLSIENTYVPYYIHAEKDKDLLFIIGSKQTLNVGSRKPHFYFQKNPIVQHLRKDLCDTLISIKNKIYFQYTTLYEEGMDFKCFVKQDQNYQYMHQRRHENRLLNVTSFEWMGDLDGDGLTDYIFTFGEKSSSTILYLSSLRKANEIVHPVAAYYSGYCC